MEQERQRMDQQRMALEQQLAQSKANENMINNVNGAGYAPSAAAYPQLGGPPMGGPPGYG